MANIEQRLKTLEQAQASQEYPWMFVHGKPTPEQQHRIDRATPERQILCFWEDRPDTAWLAGGGGAPPWELDG
jgi:hypothetical protein